jgi:hypothetical protein
VDFHSPANWLGVTAQPRPDDVAHDPGTAAADDDDDADDRGAAAEAARAAAPAALRLRVTKLELPHNGLRGDLPLGPLGQLAELQVLNLSGQAFGAVSDEPGVQRMEG